MFTHLKAGMQKLTTGRLLIFQKDGNQTWVTVIHSANIFQHRPRVFKNVPQNVIHRHLHWNHWELFIITIISWVPSKIFGIVITSCGADSLYFNKLRYLYRMKAWKIGWMMAPLTGRWNTGKVLFAFVLVFGGQAFMFWTH